MSFEFETYIQTAFYVLAVVSPLEQQQLSTVDVSVAVSAVSDATD